MTKRVKDSSNGPQSRLDRVSRDLNRTLWHGTRVATSGGVYRPATVATGQQLPVDLPASGSLKFQFAVGSAQSIVSVALNDATNSDALMTAVINNPEKYLTLGVDGSIPTWASVGRAFSLPSSPVPEDVLDLKAQNRTLLHLPATILQEVQRVNKASDVTLSYQDPATQAGQDLPPTWQPALLLRFPLEAAPKGDLAKGSKHGEPPHRRRSAESTIFKVAGTPQGERYYLDLLGLLPGDNIPDAPAVDQVLLFAQGAQDAATGIEPIQSWTIARTNLTQEARPGQFRSLSVGPDWPYIATDAEPADTLRLLQMASITNSGGYYLAASTSPSAKTLIACVVLKATQGTERAAVQLPRAANSIVYDVGPKVPNLATFEGTASLHVVPSVPPGTISFGWTRGETTVETRDDEERFGYGSISLVEYTASNGEGTVLQPWDSCIAISPLAPPDGTHSLKAKNPSVRSRSLGQGGGNETAVLQLRAAKDIRQASVADRIKKLDGSVIRFFRGSINYAAGESPYAALGSPARRLISITPGFRDVFGNRITAVGGSIQRKLFYTDAVIPPAEWPGFQFAVAPDPNNGASTISLSIAYTSAIDPPDVAAPTQKASRLASLKKILTQLQGARSDVKVVLNATPLVRNPIDITVDFIAWFKTAVIVFEQTGTSGGTITIPQMSFHCDCLPFAEPRLFQPTLQITRSEGDLLPQPTDLPSDPALKDAILNQVTGASTPVNLVAGKLQSLSSTDASSPEEFEKVAAAFQESVSGAFKLQVGFLRDQFNQHELWVIPNSLFPEVPASEVDQAVWAYATARPLNNTLETSDFVVPDFTHQVPDTGDGSTWHGYVLGSKHFVEQDFDELARASFALAEREAFRAEVVTAAAMNANAKASLQAKDQIARQLATFDGLGNPAYLVPLFVVSPLSLSGEAVARRAKDSLLQNLNAFYGVDTFVQFPLQRPGSEEHVLAFEGTVINPFLSIMESNAKGAAATLPSFSDVLLRGGESAVTVAYNVPAGTNNPSSSKEVPPVPDKTGAMQIQISHIQLQDQENAANKAANAFSRGRWLKLSSPFSLAWHGTGKTIPVALRRFPNKPILDQPTIQPAALPSGPIISAADAMLLNKWGWTIGFLAEVLDGDTVHTTIRYNEPDSGYSSVSTMNFRDSWQPTSILQCLIVLKSLSDNWSNLDSATRFVALSDLLVALSGLLSAVPDRFLAASGNQPKDTFDIVFPDQSPSGLNAQVMHRIVSARRKTVGVGTTQKQHVALNAPGEDPNNLAFVVAPSGGIGPVNNFRPSLSLVRNEAIGGHALDSRLIYRCATVEPPHEVWARNTWGALQYELEEGQKLGDGLLAFFTSFFNGADVTSLAIEIAAALYFRRQGLSVQTDYSMLPSDMPRASATDIASFVVAKCEGLLGGTLAPPPEVEQAALRLHIKVGLKGDTVKRTLVEIGSIDFPLSGQAILAGTAAKKPQRRKKSRQKERGGEM